eukprot:m51a1_g13581 hypothetical protein (200) ;mRNA; f:928-2015
MADGRGADDEMLSDVDVECCVHTASQHVVDLSLSDLCSDSDSSEPALKKSARGSAKSAQRKKSRPRSPKRPKAAAAEPPAHRPSASRMLQMCIAHSAASVAKTAVSSKSVQSLFIRDFEKERSEEDRKEQVTQERLKLKEEEEAREAAEPEPVRNLLRALRELKDGHVSFAACPSGGALLLLLCPVPGVVCSSSVPSVL